jgi:hypothetical protein
MQSNPALGPDVTVVWVGSFFDAAAAAVSGDNNVSLFVTQPGDGSHLWHLDVFISPTGPQVHAAGCWGFRSLGIIE